MWSQSGHGSQAHRYRMCNILWKAVALINRKLILLSIFTLFNWLPKKRLVLYCSQALGGTWLMIQMSFPAGQTEIWVGQSSGGLFLVCSTWKARVKCKTGVILRFSLIYLKKSKTTTRLWTYFWKTYWKIQGKNNVYF